MRPHPASALRRSTAPFSALLSALALTPSWADTATGVFADQNATLRSLDAAQLGDPIAGAHFAGTRVTSVLDAGVSTYSYPGYGKTDFWATLPRAPAARCSRTPPAPRTSATRSGSI